MPRWIRFLALLVLAAQAAALVFFLLGRLHDSQRNIVLQALVGGIVILLALGAYLLRFHSETLSLAPDRLGLVLLVLIVVAMTGVYVLYARPFVSLPYDLASWSEDFFITDIIKWRVGAKLYLSPDQSNSSNYPPAAPAVTYFLAWLFRRPASIMFYRVLQQVYLALAALLGAAAAWHLARLAEPDRLRNPSRLWLVFLAFASFLFATNRITNAFCIHLHTDAMVILATALAFWLLMKYATTQDRRWLWAMALMPSVGFLVKQYVVIWAAVYLIYLWLDGRSSLPRLIAFGAACFALLSITIGACFVIWGANFHYWVFQQLGEEIVSFQRLLDRFAEAAWCLIPGLLGGGVLLRGRSFPRLWGFWVGWLIMVLAGIYTAGIAYVPTHLGPATVVGGSFFLAAMVVLWPDRYGSSEENRAQQWLRVAFCVVLVTLVFAGMSYPLRLQSSIPPDVFRFANEIEREFKGLPIDRVLTDSGDWVYLRANVLMKDRGPILLTQHTMDFAMIDRVRRQEYDRILVRLLPSGGYSYELGRGERIARAVRISYREVRRIPHVRGVEDWPFGLMMMGDVAVLEPIPRAR